MISAPSHLLRSNGSKALAMVLVICLLAACKTQKKLSNQPPVVSAPDDTEEKILQYDPVLDSMVLVPRSAIKVDTVEWVEDKTPPIVADEPQELIKPAKHDVSQIALLMPFNAIQADFTTDHQDPKLNRYIQYYSGIKMALRKIDSMDWKVKVASLDADAAGMNFQDLISREEVKNADVIVGPYDREDIEALATYGLTHEVMVVSPWQPAFTNDTENPFLIQLFPGLGTHAQAIMDFIQEQMPEKKVYVVSRDNPSELNRTQLFKKNPGILPEDLIIKDASPDLLNTNLHSLLSDDRGTIFILPYYSKSDETFINSFMRKLHADKDTREAIVFGLPQWTGYTNLNANYMESLSVHLSISTFIDIKSPEYNNFRNEFFKQYSIFPDINAFLGYDLMLWMAQQLSTYGQEGLIGQMNSNGYGLASGYDIQPVFKQKEGTSGEMKLPLYYENKRIRIIRFLDQDFMLVR